jgi:hypothetical protein
MTALLIISWIVLLAVSYKGACFALEKTGLL